MLVMKKSLFLNLFLVIFILTGIYFLLNFNTADVDASFCGEYNLSGYAWSDNVGWVSFSCQNKRDNYDYGVSIDIDTGEMGGYAWSDSIGWIDFSPVGPYPDVPAYSVKLNLETDEITGWAKAVIANDWISFSGEEHGVTFNIHGFSGYAWGGETMGWIDFKLIKSTAFFVREGAIIIKMDGKERIINIGEEGVIEILR